MRRALQAMTALVAFAAVPAGSAIPHAQTYVMAMSLYDGGKLVSTPRLIIAPGEASRLVIEPGDGSSYKATITIDPLQDGRLQMAGAFSVTSKSAGSVSANPKLLLEPGEMGAIEFGNKGAGFEPFRAEIKITPNAD